MPKVLRNRNLHLKFNMEGDNIQQKWCKLSHSLCIWLYLKESKEFIETLSIFIVLVLCAIRYITNFKKSAIQLIKKQGTIKQLHLFT